MQELQFPIGQYQYSGPFSNEQRARFIDEIAATPVNLSKAVDGLSDEQLDTPYRPQGWTARQVVHHLPDSHINSYMRFKLAVSEDKPTIKPYHEALWAEMVDGKSAPVEVSLKFLEALHERWVMFLRSMKDSDFSRTFFHPEAGKELSLDYALGMYAWHGNHHIAHITSLRKRMGW